jgi:ATP-binding cassette, subfamily B, bacterial
VLFRSLLGGQFVELGRTTVLILAIVPLMFLIDPYLACLALVAIPLIVVFSVVFFTRIRGAFKKADEAEGAMTTQLQENLTGIRVVRAFARQDFEIGKFADHNLRFRDLQRRVIGLMSIYWSSTDFLTAVQTGLVIIAGAYWISTGRLSAGDVAAFVMYVNMFSWPVRQMGRTLADISKTTVSLNRIDDILSVPREETAAAPALATAPLSAAGAAGTASLSDAPWTPRGQVSVSHLTFTHNGDGHALKDISFDVEPGQTLAILGPSGSGKSTLVHLLLRLYEYRNGSIRVDGHELRDLPLKEARTLFGVVMQEPFLFSKSVRDNIRLGALHADDEAVQQAAIMACIHDNILEFEKGYDTVVGERGVTLSGGQRQRMALARAILKNPPILILDDALSAVDTETEVMILDALRQRHGRRTTLVIAHRLSTLMAADKILVLDGGRVAQVGTHAELIRQDGLYGRLWKIQGAVMETLDHEIQAGRPGGRTGK